MWIEQDRNYDVQDEPKVDYEVYRQLEKKYEELLERYEDLKDDYETYKECYPIFE